MFPSVPPPSMPESFAWLLLGLLMLALGGDSAVKGASGLAQRLGASPFVAGLLLMAFATSLPELAVNARAFHLGLEELALGNAVGSNIANVGLTLGIAALCAPIALRMRLLAPLLILLAVATMAVIVLGLDGTLGRIDGLVLLAAFVAMLVFLLRSGARESDDVRAEIAEFAGTRGGVGLHVVRLVIAGALMVFGARFVLQGAVPLGTGFGLSPVLIGLLPVAIATALPEVVAAIIAARRGQGDLVAGHVIGSSLFNLLFVVGGMAAFVPLAIPDSLLRFELPAALAFALVLYPVLKGDLRVSRVEGGVLVAAFVAWVAAEIWFL